MMKKHDDTIYCNLSMIFVVLLILANTIANRLISIGDLILPSAIIVFPLTYIIGDIVTEIYGFEKTRKLIIMSLLLNSLFVVLGVIAVSMPAPSDAKNILSYTDVFYVAPKIVIASICGFFVGSLANAFVMHKMKNHKRMKRYLFGRIFVSTIVGVFFDTCLFVIIAFVGSMNIIVITGIIITQFVMKIIYETVFSPITILIIKKMNRYISISS